MGATHSQTLSETPRLLTNAPSVGCVQEPDVSPQVLKSARNYTGGKAPHSNYMATPVIQWLSSSIRVSVCNYVSTYLCNYAFMCLSAFVCMYACMYVFMYVCIPIYVYIYVYTYMYISM